jgi:hypothetical protein
MVRGVLVITASDHETRKTAISVRIPLLPDRSAADEHQW